MKFFSICFWCCYKVYYFYLSALSFYLIIRVNNDFLVAESDNMRDKKYSFHPIITLGRVDIQLFEKLMRETCEVWYNSIPLQWGFRS